MEAAALLTLPLILFLSLTTNGVSARHGISIVDQPPPVLDSSGNSLQTDEYYYLVPDLNLSSPLLFPTAIIPEIVRENTCWLRVGVEIITNITGLLVKFSLVESSGDELIRESTNLIIEFPLDISPLCGRSQVWNVGPVELFRRFLTLGGDKEDQSSWFKIEKASEILDGTYKLVSTKYDEGVGETARLDLSLHLASVSGEPLPFKFKRATKNEISNTSF